MENLLRSRIKIDFLLSFLPLKVWISSSEFSALQDYGGALLLIAPSAQSYFKYMVLLSCLEIKNLAPLICLSDAASRMIQVS